MEFGSTSHSLIMKLYLALTSSIASDSVCAPIAIMIASEILTLKFLIVISSISHSSFCGLRNSLWWSSTLALIVQWTITAFFGSMSFQQFIHRWLWRKLCKSVCHCNFFSFRREIFFYLFRFSFFSLFLPGEKKKNIVFGYRHCFSCIRMRPYSERLFWRLDFCFSLRQA